MDEGPAPTHRWQPQAAGWTLVLGGDWRGPATATLTAPPMQTPASLVAVDAAALRGWNAGQAAAQRDPLGPLARQGAAPLLAVAQAQAFSDGHFDHHGHVWSTDGTLLATTQQLVWYKE